MKKKRLALAIGLLAILIAGVAYGALLTYYGRIRATVDVQQAVLVDGKDYTTIIEEGLISETAPGGETFCFKHTLTNLASVPATVNFATSYSPDGEGITTGYYIFTEYSNVVEEASSWSPEPVYNLIDNDFPAINYPVAFTVVQTCSEVMFTIYTEDGFIAELLAGGTAYDCAGFGFDVDNDGDFLDDFGILYEPDGSLRWDYSGPPGTGDWGYSDTRDPVWDEWLSGSFIDPVDVEGVSAELSEDGLSLIVTVSADKLGGLGNTYGFAMNLYKHTGFFGSAESPDQLVIHAEDVLTLGTDITDGLTIPAGETVYFYICYEFDIAIKPGTYTITTKVLPA